MVLFDEDPVALITETTNQFHIAPDKDALSRISSSLSALAFNRSSRIEAQQATMKALSRRLNTIKSQSEYDSARRDTGQHAIEVLALDGEKFRIAKAVNEIEMDGERLSGEIASLRKAIEDLNRDGSDKRRVEDDTAILKLQVYRSLGIELADGKAVVRGDKHVSIVDLNDGQNHTEELWTGMS